MQVVSTEVNYCLRITTVKSNIPITFLDVLKLRSLQCKSDTKIQFLPNSKHTASLL